jgi:hypothetical protein
VELVNVLLRFLLSFNTLLAVPFGVGLVVLLLPRRRAVGHPPALQRRAARWRRGALALGCTAAAALIYLPMPGLLGVWLAGPAFGVLALAGVLIGELLVPDPAGKVRSATLTTRRIRDYLPRRHRALMAGLLAGLVGLLTVTVVVSLPHTDARGRIRFASGGMSSTLPAWLDGVTAAAATALSLAGSAAVCLLVLRKIVNRPAVTAGAQAAARDTAMRGASAEAVFHAWGCLLASSVLTWAFIALVLSGTGQGTGFGGDDCGSWWAVPLRTAAYLTMAAGECAAVYLVTQLMKQDGRRRAAA